MSKYDSKRHPFAGYAPNAPCKVCGNEALDAIHTVPDVDRPPASEYEALKAMKDHLDKGEKAAAAEAVLAPLSRLLAAVIAEIVKQPCLCEVNAQGLMRCRRCLLLA